jgi:hypothetical protein
MATSRQPINAPCQLRLALLSTLLLIITCAPIQAFTHQASSSSSLTSVRSSTDDSVSDVAAAQQERKIRATYFLQSSGFAPSKSILSSLLDDEEFTGSEAKQSMASLEQSYRHALLSRINSVDEEYQIMSKKLQRNGMLSGNFVNMLPRWRMKRHV